MGTEVTRAFNDKARLHLELSRAGLAESVGLIDLNNAPPENTRPEIIAKKKRQHTAQILRLIEQTQVRLQEFIDDMDLKLVAANQKLRHYQVMAEERKSLEHCINMLERGEILERNPDGTLKDKPLQNAVERYAKDHNLNTDFSDDAYVLALAGNALETYPSAKQLEQLTVLQTDKVNVIQTSRDTAVSINHDLDNPDNFTGDEIKQKCNQFDVLQKSHNTQLSNIDGMIQNVLDTTNDASINVIKHIPTSVSVPTF